MRDFMSERSDVKSTQPIAAARVVRAQGRSIVRAGTLCAGFPRAHHGRNKLRPSRCAGPFGRDKRDPPDATLPMGGRVRTPRAEGGAGTLRAGPFDHTRGYVARRAVRSYARVRCAQGRSIVRADTLRAGFPRAHHGRSKLRPSRVQGRRASRSGLCYTVRHEEG